MSILRISNQHRLSNRERRLQLSRHAACRSQQRGISADLLPLILGYGERSHDGHGGIRYLMTDKAMARLKRAIGHTQQIEALAGAYAVQSADDQQTIITMGHRHH